MGRIVRRHGHFPAFSFPVPSLQHHTPRERQGMQQVLMFLRRTFFCAYGTELVLPLHEDFIEHYSLTQRTITLALPEGLV